MDYQRFEKTFQKRNKKDKKAKTSFKVKEKKRLRWHNKSGGGKIRAGTAARSTWAGILDHAIMEREGSVMDEPSLGLVCSIQKKKKKNIIIPCID